MFLPRIITFMAHRPSLDAPQRLLENGSRILDYQGRQRVFVIRRVFYDDSMTPLYTKPEFTEEVFTSPQELKTKYPTHDVWNSPILDKDNYLKVYSNG